MRKSDKSAIREIHFLFASEKKVLEFVVAVELAIGVLLPGAEIEEVVLLIEVVLELVVAVELTIGVLFPGAEVHELIGSSGNGSLLAVLSGVTGLL